MATLGRSPGAAPLTSADIPDSSITAAKVTADVATQAEIDLKANLTNAALVTPNLGTPSAGVMTNMTGAVTASLVDNAVTLAKMAGGTDGNIISYDASGDPVAIATGTDGQVLTSTGAGSPPAFEAAPGGGFVHLATLTASAYGSLAFEGYFSSDYDHYKFFYSLTASTNNTDTGIRVRQSNADKSDAAYYTMETGGYMGDNGSVSNTWLGDWGTSGAGDGTYGRISSGDNTNNAAYPTTGELVLSNPLSTTVNKTWTGQGLGYNSAATPSALRTYQFAGWYASTAVLSGFSFFYDGGNIDGKVSMFGIKNS